jgi:putative transcriptional regulator
MPKEIQFNEADLVGGMKEALAHAKGKLTLKTTKLPQPARKMSPASIARLRRTLKASTPVFAAYLNVTPDTVRSWEKNRRQPSGPALRLLQIAEKRPDILISA